MYRAATLAAMMLVAAALVSAAPVADEAKPKAKAARALQRTRDKLAKSVTIEAIDSNTPLKDVLIYVSQFDLTILVDVEAFKADSGIQEAENQPVKLPRMTNVRLETWLRLLLQQARADFYVQPDGILWVVPDITVVKYILGQKVTASFENEPVNEALRQLGDSMGLSIIVDGKRAGEKAKTLVTADLRNVTLEAAIMILADLAELKPVTIDRAIYVTTPDNAKVIQAELDKKNPPDLLKEKP